MNKYIVSSSKTLFSLLFLGVFPVFANDNVEVNGVSECAECAKGTDFFEGFAVGVDAVYSYIDVKNSITEPGGKASNGREKIDSDLHSVTHKNCHFSPSLNIGYSYFHGNWYAGLVADVSFGKNNSRLNCINGADEHLKIKGISYEVRAKGGYYFQDLNSVIYGIAGVKWRDVDYAFDFKLPGTYSISRTKSRLKNPLFVLGVGAERPISKKVSLSAEYEYAWRNSSGEASDNVGGARGSVRVYQKVKQSLKEHSVKIGLKYHF